MDGLLACVENHLKSNELEGFSDKGAESLAFIIKKVREQKEKSEVVEAALAQIHKATRLFHQEPARALVKATENYECEVNPDVRELLERCKHNPSAIFESQGPDSRIHEVHDLKGLHQLGTHLLNRANDLRRHVFCIVISDAHDIVNTSELSKTKTGTKTNKAIERLAKCFQDDGVDVPYAQLQKDLRDWVTCGAGHQEVMKLLGDGYLTIIPSGISIGVLLTKDNRRSHRRTPNIEYLKAWGVHQAAEDSGANKIIQAIRQVYREFFRTRQSQANVSPRSATSSHSVGKSHHSNASHAYSTVAAQEIPQSSASDDLSSLGRKRPSQCVDEDITADTISPEDRESQSRQKRAKTDQTRIIAQPNVHGWESQSHEIDCGPATLHPSLANHLAVSDDCSYLPTVPQQPMDDPFLANHTVEGENCSYLVQPYSQLSVNGPGLTTLANYLEESDNCCYATGPYLRQTMDSSNAPNTSLSYSSWIAPNANTASDPEPQATVNSYDGFRASARSSCAAGYPYLPSRISTEVSNDFGSAHTDGVSMAMYLEVSEDDPHLRFDLRNPITLDPGIITSVQ